MPTMYGQQYHFQYIVCVCVKSDRAGVDIQSAGE